MRKKALLLATVIATMVFSIQSMPAGCENGEPYTRWVKDDGSYYTSTWAWVDDNDDRLFERYYFDENGYVVKGKNIKIDGELVDENGEWMKAPGVKVKKAMKIVCE